MVFSSFTVDTGNHRHLYDIVVSAIESAHEAEGFYFMGSETGYGIVPAMATCRARTSQMHIDGDIFLLETHIMCEL